MVEEEDLQFCRFRLRPATLLERSLVDQITLLISQFQVDCLSWFEYQLLIKLAEVEPGFCPT